jgi:hypothetical protein
VPPLALTVPPPWSVANPAALPPAVVMVTLFSVKDPPCEAITPCAPSSVQSMTVLVSETDEPVPVAKAPLALSPVVEIVPPVTVAEPPADASKAAFRP